MINYDIEIPKESLKKGCDYKTRGYVRLSCYFLKKGETIYNSFGNWYVSKGPSNVGNTDEVGDWREGVDTDGKWKLQYNKPVEGWTTVKEYDIPA